VQINLKSGEVFKVIAEAKNYLGAKSSELTLKYGSPAQIQAELQEDERENQQVDQDEQINADPGDVKEPDLKTELKVGLQSGGHCSIALEGNNCIGKKVDRLVVGDIETVLDKTPHYRSFLYFDIIITERYSGVSVKDSALLIDTTAHPPVSGFGDFCIGVVEDGWYRQVGPGPVTSPSNAVLETPQEIARYSNFQGGRIDVKSSVLNNILQRYTDSDKKWIVFVFYWSNPQGYPDGGIHYVEINWANMDLYITHD